jgi:hypothetical protein
VLVGLLFGEVFLEPGDGVPVVLEFHSAEFLDLSRLAITSILLLACNLVSADWKSLRLAMY